MLSSDSRMTSPFKLGWARFETYSRVCNKHHFRWLQICYTGWQRFPKTIPIKGDRGFLWPMSICHTRQ